MLKKIINKIVDLCINLYPFCIKKKIVFINFNGKGYGCNLKYICEEIMKQNLDCDLVWLVDNLNYDMPDRVKKVKIDTIEGLFELKSAKIIITNVQNGFKIIKNKKQFVIETWHASYSPKRLEFDAQDKLNKTYLKFSKYTSKIADIFLSNSSLQTLEYRNAFKYKGKIAEYGYPRNDVFFKLSKEALKHIKDKLNLSNKRLVLYTPTFRDDGSIIGYNLDVNLILKTFDSKYNDKKTVFLLRMHPNIVNYKSLFEFNDRVIDVTKYDDVQELLIISDILITDYSSTMFDFMLLKNEIYIYASDINDYDKLRGLKDFMYNLPFKICKTSNELADDIINRDYDIYEREINDFKEKYKSFDDGNASYKVVEEIKKILN